MPYMGYNISVPDSGVLLCWNQAKNWGKGIKITIDEDDSLAIDCNINVGFGQSVVTVAKSVQEAITAALASTTGVQASAVNVNVCGIIRQ